MDSRPRTLDAGHNFRTLELSNFRTLIRFETSGSKRTSRAGAAACADDAVVAGERIMRDILQDAQLIRERTGLGLIQPHERRMNAEGVFHREVECGVARLDKCIAAVRIAAGVRLADAGVEVVDSTLLRDNRGHQEKHHVASVNDGVWKAAPLAEFLNGDLRIQQRA